MINIRTNSVKRKTRHQRNGSFTCIIIMNVGFQVNKSVSCYNELVLLYCPCHHPYTPPNVTSRIDLQSTELKRNDFLKRI